MGRAPCCEKEGLKRGAWKPEEDQILISYVQKHGLGNWHVLPKQAGLLRCGKSCRLRWFNYLRPDIKRGNFTQEEEKTIIKLHERLGNRWSAIAARLPGRTDNEIKNIWHTSLKKKVKNDKLPQTSKEQSSSALPKSPSKEPNISPEMSSSELSSVVNESIQPEHREGGMSSPGIESAAMNCSRNIQLIIKQEEMEVYNCTRPRNVQLIIKQEEMESSNCTRPEDKCASHDQVFPLDESSKQPSEPKFEFPSSEVDKDMEFWFNVFFNSKDLPELPDLSDLF